MGKSQSFVVAHQKRHFRCPLCDNRSASIKPRRPVGEWGERWWVGCLRCEDGGDSGRWYLKELADAVGCKPIDLLQRADEVLAPILERARSSDSIGAANLPPSAVFVRLAEQLEGSTAQTWLTRRRGISSALLAELQVGLWRRKHGAPRLVFPMRDGLGRIVSWKSRQHGSGRQMLCPRRSGSWDWPLYPWPAAASREPLIVCAGELDALCAISAGLDACSVTLGADFWADAWTAAIERREVVVCFDNGEQRQAKARVRSLVAHGVQATRLDLRSFGMATPKGDLSDLLLSCPDDDPQELLKGAG